MMQVDEPLARRHYEAHVERPFFPSLLAFITSSPIVALAIEGPGAVEITRSIMGATDPLKADIGTLRKMYGISIDKNSVHGSDSLENAKAEIEFFFKK